MLSPLGAGGKGVGVGGAGAVKGRIAHGGGGHPPSAAAAAVRSKGMAGHVPVYSTPTQVLETVDLTAEEGLLWHPISMRSVVCPPDAEEELGCDAVVRFCLIHMAEYQKNPWKYPMAAMLQKMSQCQAPENSRAYRLSTLRVSRKMCRREGGWGASAFLAGGGSLTTWVTLAYTTECNTPTGASYYYCYGGP